MANIKTNGWKTSKTKQGSEGIGNSLIEKFLMLQ